MNLPFLNVIFNGFSVRYDLTLFFRNHVRKTFTKVFIDSLRLEGKNRLFSEF